MQLRKDIIHAPGHRLQPGNDRSQIDREGAGTGHTACCDSIDEAVCLGLQETGETGGVHHRDSLRRLTVNVVPVSVRERSQKTYRRLTIRGKQKTSMARNKVGLIVSIPSLPSSAAIP